MVIQHYFDRAKVDYDEVYEAGKKAEWNEFWDSFQNNGKRTTYPYGFYYWGDGAFYPKYDIKPTGWAASIFSAMGIIDFKQRLIDCGVTLDMSKAASFAGLFASSKYNKSIPTINTTSATSVETLFHNNFALVEVEKVVLKNDGSQTFRDVFYECKELVHLTIEGVIGQNGFNLQYSTKLSKASITSVINALSTTTNGLTATFSKTAVNKAFETASGANDGTTSTEWLALVATKNNWTISLV